MDLTHVKGKKIKKIVLYALSTCVWCKKTRGFLDKLGVEYDYTYVDLLKSKERDEVEEEVEKWNPSCSFPTIVIDNNDCVVGYDENEIKEKLGL